MRRILVTFLLMVCVLMAQAQNISVSSFRLLETDLTANTAGTIEKDQNGETAALIKVVTTQTGFIFDGGALGIVKTVPKPSEIWVYVPRGLKKITISHPQLGILRDYYLNIPIEAARTYEMVLVAGEVQTIVKQARTSQYVVFQLTPPDAVVELDGDLLKTEGGMASKMMKFGTYNYRVQAPDYLLEAGSVTIDDPENKKIVNISLKPNFAKVNINVDNNAEIWINGNKKGDGSWSGNLGAGTYEIEAKKAGYRSTLLTKDIEVTPEPQNIGLQTPTPIYGEADINSSPGMADIYIDGKKIGQTPQLISELLVGQHQLLISKQGFKDYNANLTVREGEAAMVSAKLENIETEQAAVTSGGSISTGDRQTITVGDVSFNMIRVDGGTFTMGATSEQGSDAYKDEKPTHQVALSPYYIGETEVTQALWETVMGKNPSLHEGDNRPVEYVTWKDCQKFIKKLNKWTGLNFRLPTEAEWEYAARGGNKSKGYKYSGSNKIIDVAWFYNNSKGQTHDIKTKQANELGLYDMSGNVWEWCQDWYGSYDSNMQTNPIGASSGSNFVLRGGSSSDFATSCRVSRRNNFPLDFNSTSFKIGLRLAL